MNERFKLATVELKVYRLSFTHGYKRRTQLSSVKEQNDLLQDELHR